MQKKLGLSLQATSGLLTLMLAGASDMGHISAGVLALGLLAAALLVCAGQLVIHYRSARQMVRLPMRTARQDKNAAAACRCSTFPGRI